MRTLVVDALARATGRRYATFDVVGVGPRLVAGLLNQLGVVTDLKTYEYIMDNPEILDNYDVILISAMTSDAGAVKKLLDLVNRSGCVSILGGPISLEFYDVLSSMDVDIIVVGEGERQLINIFTRHAKHLIERDFERLRSVKGIAFKLGRRIVFTGFEEFTPVKLINSIKPYTRVDRCYEYYWARRFYVEVVRGCSNFYRPMIRVGSRRCIKCLRCREGGLRERLWCPQLIPPGCGFCNVPLIFGPPRSRSVEAIVNEIRELIKYGARRIVLSAPDFLDYGREHLVRDKILTDPCSPGPNHNAIEYLLNKIYEIPEIMSGEVKIFVENVKACLVDERVAGILGRFLKGTTIHIGMETGSDDYNLYIIGKPIKVEQVFQAVKMLKKHGLRPYIYLIYGLPYMDERVYVSTINALSKLKELGVEKITLYKFMPLPQTLFNEISWREKSSLKEYIDRLRNEVSKFNLEAKRDLLNKIVRAYIIKTRRGFYGYPEFHGPVIIVTNGKSKYDGCLCEVRIIKIGERSVYGKIVKIIKCYKRTKKYS